MATRAKSAKKSAAKKSTAARKPASRKPASKSAGVSLAMSIRSERVAEPKPKPKPKSNYCVDHGRLLRADRSCPVSTCRFHDKPMPD
jgi:hypothetical protein